MFLYPLSLWVLTQSRTKIRVGFQVKLSTSICSPSEYDQQIKYDDISIRFQGNTLLFCCMLRIRWWLPCKTPVDILRINKVRLCTPTGLSADCVILTLGIRHADSVVTVIHAITQALKLDWIAIFKNQYIIFSFSLVQYQDNLLMNSLCLNGCNPDLFSKLYFIFWDFKIWVLIS